MAMLVVFGSAEDFKTAKALASQIGWFSRHSITFELITLRIVTRRPG